MYNAQLRRKIDFLTEKENQDKNCQIVLLLYLSKPMKKTKPIFFIVNAVPQFSHADFETTLFFNEY